MGSLWFDRDQRYQVIAEIAARLGVPETATLLDVGGGTGELACHMGCESFWTVDPLGGGPRHIRGSMHGLPFGSRSFDLVIQADALEHVPSEWRQEALKEMARVSKRWLIWIGPVDSPATVEAETSLCGFHRLLSGGREMDWLAEHRRLGLPHEEEVVSALASAFEDWAWWPSCDLSRWWILKRLELELDAGPYNPRFEEGLNQWYRQEGWKSDFRVWGATPAYRRVFVGIKRGKLPEGVDSPPSGSPLGDVWSLLYPLIEAVRGKAGITSDGTALEPSVAKQLERIARVLERETPPRKPGFLARLRGE